MAYGVVVPSKMASQDVNSYARSVVSASALENGYVVQFSGYSTTTGEGEVWTAIAPSSGAGLVQLWMVIEPEVVLTASKYKGIDPDVRNFITPIGEMATAYKLQIGDILRMSADAVTGTISTNTFVVATAGDFQLTWAAAAVTGVSLKLRATTYFSIGLGTIGTQRITAYDFEVVAIS